MKFPVSGHIYNKHFLSFRKDIYGESGSHKENL